MNSTERRLIVYREIKGVLKKILSHRQNGPVTLQPEDEELIQVILSKKLTYLSHEKLASLAESCHLIETADLPGIFIEAGCALGGSAILISSLKRDARPFRVYDVFGMIPPPTAADTPDVHDRYATIKTGMSEGIGGDKYYGYEENLYEIVQANMADFKIDLARQRVLLVKGLVQQTMKIEQPVAFAHVDVDWYEPVKTCLERVIPQLVIGGIVVLDDYHAWGGCRKAADEFFAHQSHKFVMDDSAGSMKITRVES
jgi:Macrocin-O-methyltransferase (TylF)